MISRKTLPLITLMTLIRKEREKLYCGLHGWSRLGENAGVEPWHYSAARSLERYDDQDYIAVI